MAGQGNYNVNQASSRGMQAAQAGTGMGMGYQAPTLAGSNMQQYQNPYTDQVVNTSMNDLNRSNQMALNNVSAQATGAGAFGGSRHGVAEAETNRAFMDQAARTSANLRSQGFNNAQNAAQFDIGNNMNAANMRLGAAQQMGGLANQAFGMGRQINQDMMRQGSMQQALQQQLIDRARQQYQGYTGSPEASLSLPLAALGQAPIPETTTQTKQPGLFDYLSVAASLPSDRRLKENVEPHSNVGGVQFYTWDWNDEGKRIADKSQPRLGVIADELQETHPHLVHRADDGYLRVNYNGLAAEIGIAA